MEMYSQQQATVTTHDDLEIGDRVTLTDVSKFREEKYQTTAGSETIIYWFICCSQYVMMTELNWLQSCWYTGKENRNSVVCRVSSVCVHSIELEEAKDLFIGFGLWKI